MQLLKVSNDAPNVFLLSGELNRITVNDGWPHRVEEIKKAAKQQPVILDLREIEQVDTAGLAWIINLLRDCKAQNVSFTLKNVPQTLINLAKISDVEGLIPLQ
ncbi:STAS domain-containing protein [Flavobacterium sp. W21_SRS_FM6]|uniref:STAS domain-containing protein n=1 Tax=Flavobacterium sp. W21_SRS_FM6 TaxID=3240268 RepID=UPI003F90A6B2